ncbi:MAG: NADH-quinone oxidoreductase subunit C [Verrucomicrobiota bacterium]|nr:NADH-quinone oxidoreductase subunit C [Verrucomicrobiota bacterium]
MSTPPSQPSPAASPGSDPAAATSAFQPFSPSALLPCLLAKFPGAEIALIQNPGPAVQHSLLLDAARAREIAFFLRDDDTLKLDFCSNVTGVDWPDKEIVETTKTTAPDPAGGAPKVVEQKTKKLVPGYLEVVYHLFSMALKHGPVIIRMRTANRTDRVSLPSLTPVWRSCEFQEREVFDLFGVVFEGHPDLRRILMWDEFKDHPMRKDYIEPDDYEWEPTPHGAVLEKAKRHHPSPAAEEETAEGPKS